MRANNRTLASALRKPPSPKETYEQEAFISWCDALPASILPIRVVGIPNFSGRLGKLTARHSVRLNAEGRRKGYPDIALDMARGGFNGLRIEMKRADATPSDTRPEQHDWHRALSEQGYAVFVCKGAREAAAVLLEYLGIDPTVERIQLPL